MNTEVDYFVILEAPTTFTGLKKKPDLPRKPPQILRIRRQIIHHILTDAPAPISNASLPGSKEYEQNAWIQEKFQRDAMFTQVFPHLMHETKTHRRGRNPRIRHRRSSPPGHSASAAQLPVPHHPHAALAVLLLFVSVPASGRTVETSASDDDGEDCGSSGTGKGFVGSVWSVVQKNR
ncbi:hypothetical protein DID88_002686 [Monilinia fructigena]|uniref:Uncharacterized protein n=1 Tax=Monilinia fructigena TaxID=38457 RepID=A0A395IPJ9_9HELO|nr:hypothetical protein DID88_002686 [Monilinia fructigena]